MTKSLFSNIKLSEVTVPNRIGLSPMCQYCVKDGIATEWQHIHLCTRAVGGTGLVMTEATAVEPRGRITPFDLGIWSDKHAQRLEKTVSFIKQQGSVPGIQLSHAGRKASHEPPRNGRKPLSPAEGGWDTIAPSDVPYPDNDPAVTRSMSHQDIANVVDAFEEAAVRADSAGFDVLELHAAHGYLIHQFLSPVANRRDDEYGGNFKHRTRFLRDIINRIKNVWPEKKAIVVRISATDWLPDRESWTVSDSIKLATQLEQLGVHMIDVSAGGIHPKQNISATGPGYQVPYAEAINEETEMAISTVGKITSAKHASAIIQNGRADMVRLGREFLRNPYWPLNAAHTLDENVSWPTPYHRGKFY